MKIEEINHAFDEQGRFEIVNHRNVYAVGIYDLDGNEFMIPKEYFQEFVEFISQFKEDK